MAPCAAGWATSSLGSPIGEVDVMADTARFGHDSLGHLISDKLLEVPRFQRSYSWDEENVPEFLEDIARAKSENRPYFMGTIVLADPEAPSPRQLIVDGQQRIITTALVFIAIRDRLAKFGRTEAANSVEVNHLANYVLEEERKLERLTVSASDYGTYSALLAGTAGSLTSPKKAAKDLITNAHVRITKHLDELAPTPDDYRALIELATFLDSHVQVLVATASGLAEAYVIFETLNDRGADLTTADLLKNFIFSRAKTSIGAAENSWARLTGAFEKPDDLVRLIRYDYMARQRVVTNRGLYKAIQDEIEAAPSVTPYLKELESSLKYFRALKEPDDALWSSIHVEVKDSLLAFRRFGFDSNMPLLIAAFKTWPLIQAATFVSTVAAWSIRAWFAGTLGGGVAESAFSEAAVAITSKNANTAKDVLGVLDARDLVPADTAFRQ